MPKPYLPLVGTTLLAFLAGCGNSYIPAAVSLEVSSPTITQESTLTLSAKAEGSSLVKVVFYDGSTKLGEDAAAPYAFDVNLTASQNGEHTYRSVAVDGVNKQLAVAEQKVTVNIAQPNANQPKPKELKTLTIHPALRLIVKSSDGRVPIKEFRDDGSRSMYACRVGLCIGDDSSNNSYALMVDQVFDLPQNAEIVSAKVYLDGFSRMMFAGGNSPADTMPIPGVLGNLKASTLELSAAPYDNGQATTSEEVSAYTRNLKILGDMPNTVQISGGQEWTTVDIHLLLQSTLNNSKFPGRVRFQLAFDLPSNEDNKEDSSTATGYNRNQAPEEFHPKVIVEYRIP